MSGVVFERRRQGKKMGTEVLFGAGLPPSSPLSCKRLELGLPVGHVTLVLGKLGGGAWRRREA